MSKFQKVKDIWKVIVNEWKTQYRLVFSNEETHEQSFIIRKITIQKIVVVAVLAAVVLIALTSLIIALTPLRTYIPGYTTQKDYKIYKQTAARIDSLERIIAINQEYIDNISDMFAGDVPTADETDEDVNETPTTHPTIRDKKRMAESNEILEEAEMIISRNHEETDNSNVPGISQAKISNISIHPPTMGTVIKSFNISEGHYGLDIASVKNSVITCIADGVVIFSGYLAGQGNVIIIQHPGNLISVYKRNASLLKKTGTRVRSGEPIASMGNVGKGTRNYLHFELWYNGFPINPLNYIVIE